jgi:hypothetical protein
MYETFYDGKIYLTYVKEGAGGGLTVVSPDEALGLYKNGVKVKNVPHPEKLVPDTVVYSTKDGGWLEGTRGRSKRGYSTTKLVPEILPDSSMRLSNTPNLSWTPPKTRTEGIFTRGWRCTGNFFRSAGGKMSNFGRATGGAVRNAFSDGELGPYGIYLWGEPVLAGVDHWLADQIKADIGEEAFESSMLSRHSYGGPINAFMSDPVQAVSEAVRYKATHPNPEPDWINNPSAGWGLP